MSYFSQIKTLSDKLQEFLDSLHTEPVDEINETVWQALEASVEKYPSDLQYFGLAVDTQTYKTGSGISRKEMNELLNEFVVKPLNDQLEALKDSINKFTRLMNAVSILYPDDVSLFSEA